MSDTTALVAVPPPQTMQMVIATNAQDWRRPRDDFELMADGDWVALAMDVAVRLDVLPFSSKGKTRFQLVKNDSVRQMMDRALRTLGSEFDADAWYYDMLPQEYRETPDGKFTDLRLQAATSCDVVQFKVDWLGALCAVEHANPGIVRVIHNAMRTDSELLLKMRASVAQTATSTGDGPLPRPDWRHNTRRV